MFRFLCEQGGRAEEQLDNVAVGKMAEEQPEPAFFPKRVD